jgi:histidyl-tRNA synthetase
MIKEVKGMKDIVAPEANSWEELRGIASRIFSSFSYDLIITPILEKQELFSRSVGEDTDVVTKEMYTFIDRSGEKLALRPEGTASIMRAYFSNFDSRSKVLKAWYWGPMFRHEKPQKGRYRQFFQFGLEAVGTDSPYIDSELIYVLDSFYKHIGIKDFEIEINSIGCKNCRPKYKNELVTFLRNNKSKLCETCAKRIEKNPLRVLDCKNDVCQKVIINAPKIKNYICDNCSSHYRKVLFSLNDLNIEYKENPYLVRGLDYYVKTVFEFVSKDLDGRQNALGGGGRYDELSSSLGEKTNVPAVGYAGGIERMFLVLENKNLDTYKKIYIAFLDEETREKYVNFIIKLKNFFAFSDKKVQIIDEGYKVLNAKKHLSKADKLVCSYAIIAGKEELKKSELVLKDLYKRKEEKIKIDIKNLDKTFSKILGGIVFE